MASTRKFDTLIHSAIVVTVNPDFEVIPDGWIGISNGRIEAVQSTIDSGPPLDDAQTLINAAGGIILPGLVNTHTHLPMTLFRGLADDLPLMEWLNDHIFPAEAKWIAPKAVEAGVLLACAEMLLSGTTTCCDGYFLETHVAEAVRKAGLRAVLAQGVIDFPAPGAPDPAQNVALARQYVESWQNRHPLITPSIFCHSPYTCSAKTLKQAKAAAAEAGVLFQIHAAETKGETGMLPGGPHRSAIAYMDQLGLLDAQTLLVHAVWIDAEDIAIIAARGAKVSHNPESNMKLASGIAPVPALLAAGVCVGLGTDGCAGNNNLDLFGEMAAAARLHKVVGQDPTLMSAAEVIKMATIDGARAIGMADRIGSLEPGKQADLIVLDTAQPHLTPLYHPESHLVYAACGNDVTHVFIDGNWVVKHRKVRTFDVEQIMLKVGSYYQPQIAQALRGCFKIA